MVEEIRNGFETAYIDGTVVSSSAYRPQFISNNYKEGKKVLSAIEQELLNCDHFQISVAFITSSGIAPLLLTLQELSQKGIPGEILTTDYLNFSEPKALEKLNSLPNIKIKMYNTEKAGEGFHTKGYIFKKEEIYRIIIGSSNITLHALTQNKEWNTKLISTEQGEMAKEIVEEFNALWNSEYAVPYEECREIYKERFEIIRHQREMASAEAVPSIEKYKLKPNSMQVGFITNLKKIVESGESRALLISATGTGKTYASAFAMREMGFKKVLFLVHRGQLARQTKKSYERVFAKKVTMGLVGAGYHDYDADYIFATIQTLNRDEHLLRYEPDEFDCIVLDEAHHVPADTYQKVMNHFRPKLWLGMTATPDKRDDNVEGRNVYELFHYQIAYEIRLGQAMEEDLLCPFHYFGISDLKMIGDGKTKQKNLSEQDFIRLTGDERVRHIIEQAQYFGYSGERVKGLIFCSRIEESEMLSQKFNQIINPETGEYFRTIALNGSASEEERQSAFERLATDEECTEDGKSQLDYIFSVEILNEGVDIVEVNQVIMLRPTQSPIVFIQQLGRGLRKAEGKEYVVILDFIGNYNNNFMIPIALSGDRTYNADTIRKYVISGNSTIPGASTVHFDEISKEKIFESIDRIKGMKTIIKDSYTSLKNRLGRVPYLIDFYENGEVDPLVIIREFKTYQNFLEIVENEMYVGKISEEEMIKLEYLSKTILSGTRPYELLILKSLLTNESVNTQSIANQIKLSYGYNMNVTSFENAIDVLKGHFVSKEEELEKYGHIDLLDKDSDGMINRLKCLKNLAEHGEFHKQLRDIVEVGLRRYEDKYAVSADTESPFVLYEKYSRRDVSLLMNCGKDLSSTMYGMKRIDDDVFIFVTYHKTESDDEKEYVEGKPDYADAFEDNVTFKWDSQMGRGVDSGYVADVLNAKRKHLLVKKSDAEMNFYYVGQFKIMNYKPAKKKDNAGKLRDITKFEMRMQHAVREDLLQYLQSNIKTAEEM
ncbi:MAG: DEAD/DEAH box helicase [Lachnospiraceae bacterium]|nr:DEAD/DEAH box helicase [Lachnospiraceae bacterium]